VQKRALERKQSSGVGRVEGGGCPLGIQEGPKVIGKERGERTETQSNKEKKKKKKKNHQQYFHSRKRKKRKKPKK